MRWLEPEPNSSVTPAVRVELLRQAVDQHPDNPAFRERLGRELAARGDFGAAVEAFEFAAQTEPRAFQAWANLAHCYEQLNMPDAALEACRRGEAVAPSQALHFRRGCILAARGRTDDARAAFRRAIGRSETGLQALINLLAPLARDPDGGALLEFCDALPAVLRATSLVRGHRAIALSRLGRTDEALKLVDLTRHVAQVSLAPTSEFGSVEQFNRMLASEILTRPLDDADRKEFDIDRDMFRRRSPLYDALRKFVCRAIDDYLAQADERGLSEVMPPLPESGMLGGSSVVLREDGHNGEHLHRRGYVSTVYYVSVPDCIAEARDERGALALGKCEKYTGGYIPCWGTRYIRPVSGTLVLFPSHVFHDVVPSQSDQPRISIAADLWPVSPETAD